MSSAVIRRVMLVCRQNSRRSQIAHGLLAARAPQGVEVCSAGLNGAGGLAPEAIAVMEEWEIDLRGQSSNALAEYRAQDFAVVIVLCGCLDELPAAWRQRPLVEDWDVADPRAGDLASHRHARDVIAARVEGLLLELGRD
jgi:arsenate reductase